MADVLVKSENGFAVGLGKILSFYSLRRVGHCLKWVV